MPAGRPSKFDPYWCEEVIALGKDGKSITQISAVIDVPKTTMLRWADDHEEFRTALTRAKELEQAWWEEQGQGALRDKEFNASLWLQNVKSRFRADYGDKITAEHSGPDGKPMQVEDVSARDVVRNRVAGIATRLGGGNLLSDGSAS